VRPDPIRLLIVVVGLALTVFFAVTRNELGPYWLVLLGGMIGVTVVGANSRQNGPNDDDGDNDTKSRKLVEQMERARRARHAGDGDSGNLRRSRYQTAG
jgi:hypothetical protein